MKAALERLDLTQAQKDKLRDLAESARPGFQAQREQRRADRSALRTALETPNPDATAIGNLILKMKQGRAAAKAERQRLQVATFAVLTPEQKVKLEAYLDAFKTVRHRGRHLR